MGKRGWRDGDEGSGGMGKRVMEGWGRGEWRDGEEGSGGMGKRGVEGWGRGEWRDGEEVRTGELHVLHNKYLIRD